MNSKDLGIKACLAGYRVLFTIISTLINQLKESRSEKTLHAFENKFAKYDLAISEYCLIFYTLSGGKFD